MVIYYPLKTGTFNEKNVRLFFEMTPYFYDWNFNLLFAHKFMTYYFVQKKSKSVIFITMTLQHHPKQTLKNRCRSKVRFDTQRIVHKRGGKPFSKDEASQLWYQKNEIRRFKLQLRGYILGKPVEETRGFERQTIKRAFGKYLARKCTLMASRKGYSQEDIAAISEKCSAVAQDQAFSDGLKDYCDAYCPEKCIIR
jgi:hypothetical protein